MQTGPPSNIDDTISATNQKTLYEVLWSLKNMISTNPEQAKQILASNPAFSASILKALLALNLIDENKLRAVTAPQGPPEQAMNQNFPPGRIVFYFKYYFRCLFLLFLI